MGRMSNTISFRTFQKDVETSGTPVRLVESGGAVPDGVEILVKAKSGNSQPICVGFSSASALNSSTGHIRLSPNTGVGLQVDSLSSIWIDSLVDGEGVEVVYESNAA